MQKIIAENNFETSGNKYSNDFDLIRDIEEHNNVRITVVNSDGKVLQQSKYKDDIHRHIMEISFKSKTDKRIVEKVEWTRRARTLKNKSQQLDSFAILAKGEKQTLGSIVLEQINPCGSKKEYLTQIGEVADKFKISRKEFRPVFYDFTSRILLDTLKQYPVEPVRPHEYEYLNYVRNSFICMEKDNLFVEKGYQYDINAFFAYVLQHKDFVVPIKAGTTANIKTVDELEQYFAYNVMLKVDFSNFPYMRDANDKIYYSQYDIKMFKKANVKFEIFETNDDNIIFFTKEQCMSGDVVFGDLVKDLYAMKHDGNKVAGSVMRMLHGVLGQTCLERVYRNNADSHLCLDRCFKMDDKYYYCVKGTNQSLFKSGFARIKMFLYSFTRYIFYKKYIHEEDHRIYRIYVDSIITDKPIDDAFIGDKIGQLKFEGMYENVTFDKVNISYKKELFFEEPTEQIY